MTSRTAFRGAQAFLCALSGLAIGISSLEADAPTGPEDLQARLQSVQALIEAYREGDAEAAARSLLAEVEASSGPDSPPAADVMFLLLKCFRLGDKATTGEARGLGERLVALRERLHGPEHLELASSLMEFGALLRVRAEFGPAREQFERALAIREKLLGSDDPAVAHALEGLSVIASDLGDYEGAYALDRRTLAIRERAFGPDHPLVAQSLNGIAAYLSATSDHAGAKSVYERVLAIREKHHGPDDPTVADALFNLALNDQHLGAYDSAAARFERLITIYENSVGPEHPYVVEGLNSYGHVLDVLREYAKAREVYERALAVGEKVIGPDHPIVGLTRLRFGHLLRDTGDYAAAEPMLTRALEINLAAYGPDHNETAKAENALAQLYDKVEDFDRSLAHYDRAVEIWERAYAPDHPHVAIGLIGRAAARRTTGDAAGARTDLLRALAINETAYGPDAAMVAVTLDGLADVAFQEADLGTAAESTTRALAIMQGILGPDHPALAAYRCRRARAFTMAGDAEAALAELAEAEALSREHFRLTALGLSEREALRFAAVRNSGLNLAMTLAVTRFDSRPDRVHAIWDGVVRSRCLVFDEMAARRRATHWAREAGARDLVTELSDASSELARLVLRGGEDADAATAVRAEAARLRRESAERDLSRRSRSFRRDRGRAALGLDDVIDALPASSALVAFTQYDHLPGGRDAGAGGVVPSYLAFVLTAAHEPRVVRLGAASAIDTLVFRWHSEAARGTLRRSPSPQAAEASCRAAGRTLRAAIWDPLAPWLTGVGRVFVVPDGSIHLVNFSALPAGASAYLVESGPIFHTLTAERDLVPDGGFAPGHGLLAVGGVDFDSATSLDTGNAELFATARPAGAPAPFRGDPPDCPAFHSIRFAPLPASGEEVDDVVAIWESGAQPAETALRLRGPTAGEEAVKRLAPGRRIVHLATHGFVLGGACAAAATGARGIGGLRPRSTSADVGRSIRRLDDAWMRPPGAATLADEAVDNPLLRSGLALAGANRRDEASEGEDDGILTADEVAAMDLEGVEWAVLSACDTGIGEAHAGEGVFGLRRAFLVAGARTVVTSLWTVRDEVVRAWSEALYRARFHDGLDTAAAVQRADRRLLETRRSAGESTHPFFWAAFVAAGEWR
jgi:CHAT domain-containing protein/tetratricopeptide (TPR) repeat protein